MARNKTYTISTFVDYPRYVYSFYAIRPIQFLLLQIHQFLEMNFRNKTYTISTFVDLNSQRLCLQRNKTYTISTFVDKNIIERLRERNKTYTISTFVDSSSPV